VVQEQRPGPLDALAGWLDEVRGFWAGHLERQGDWRPGDELEIKVAFRPAGAGTVVTINVRGWERIAGGEELGRGYGSGARELPGWYAEAAATA
jgi:hypothetical protein